MWQCLREMHQRCRSAWCMRVWMRSRSCPSRFLNDSPRPLLWPDSLPSCFLHVHNNASCNKRCQEKIYSANANCNNLLSTRELSAGYGPVSPLAGSAGAVAQRLSPQDMTQHELTPAYFLSGGPASLWYTAASGLGQRKSCRDVPAVVWSAWQAVVRVALGAGRA